MCCTETRNNKKLASKAIWRESEKDKLFEWYSYYWKDFFQDISIIWPPTLYSKLLKKKMQREGPYSGN